MNSFPVPILKMRVTGIEDVDNLVNAGYNPRSEDEDKDTFIKEWEATNHVLEAELSKHWTDGVDDQDIYLVGDWTNDRMMCVEIGNREILDETFLPIAYSAVAKLPGDYCVDYCDSWGCLKTALGEPHPHFNIFITKEAIWIYTENDDLLDLLGIADLIQEDTRDTPHTLRLHDGENLE